MAKNETDLKKLVTLSIALNSGAVVDVIVPLEMATTAITNWKNAANSGFTGPRDLISADAGDAPSAMAFKADQIAGIAYRP